MVAPRRERRIGFDIEARVGLAEDDLDESDENFQKMLASVDKQIDEFRKALGKTTAVLLGILVSVATASILLALNLATS